MRFASKVLRKSRFEKIRYAFLLPILAVLIVLGAYWSASKRFSDREVATLKANNSEARIDLGTAVRTNPRQWIRIAYAANFPAIIPTALISHAIPPSRLTIGQVYSVNVIDILFLVCVSGFWYLIGAFVDRNMRRRSGERARPSWIVISLQIALLAAAVIIGTAALLRFASEAYVVQGQEVVIAGIGWSLIVFLYLLSSFSKYLSLFRPNASGGRPIARS